MSKVKRVYVEKKQPYAVKAKELTEDIKGIWHSLHSGKLQ